MDKAIKIVRLATSVLLMLATTIFIYGAVTAVLAKSPKSYETLDKMPDYSLSQNSKQLPALAHPSIIRLHGKDESKKLEFFCSAFVISDVYAVTAGHCLDNSGKMSTKDITIFETVEVSENKFEHKTTGVVVHAAGINRRGDTGLIVGDFSNFKKLKFTPYPADILTILRNNIDVVKGTLVSVGFPYGDIPLSSRVQFKGIRDFHLAGYGALYPGMSGGALIDPITGYVVGINSYVDNDIVAFSSLVGLLESLNVKVVE